MSQVRSIVTAAFVTRPRATVLPLICAFLDRPMTKSGIAAHGMAK